MLNITLPGGDIRQVAEGTTVDALCREISMGLYRNACAALVDGKVADLRTELTADCAVAILTFDDHEGRKAYWHTASHVMAQAVKRLYPSVKLTIGPSIDEGFYYDFDSDISITPEVLTEIEAEMKKIIKEGLEITRFTLPALRRWSGWRTSPTRWSSSRRCRRMPPSPSTPRASSPTCAPARTCRIPAV